MNWLIREYFPLTRVDKYTSWALGLCALVLYLALPVRVISYDSLAYAIETTSKIIQRHFHPHHLLFSRSQLLFLNIIRLFSTGANPLISMVWFNSAFGALTLVFLHRISLHLSGRRLLSILITIILALSWTFYFFSSSGDTVIPANFLFILALFLSVKPESHAMPRLLLIALITGLALLYHQMSLFYLPIIVIVALRKCPRAKLTSRVLLFVVFSLGLATAVYLAVMIFYYGFTNINSWWEFLTADTQRSKVWGSYDPWDYLKGLGYLLNSGTYAFSIVNPQGDEFLWMVISRSLCWALLGTTTVMIIIRVIKREWLGAVVGISLLATMTFVNWWEAPTTDYWVLPWMLLLLLLAWAGRGRLNTLLTVWLLFYIPAQLTVNWYYKMAVLTDPQSDLKGRIMEETVKLITPGKTILLTDDPNLALRSEMAGVRALQLPRQFVTAPDVINTFVSLYLNSRTRDYAFIVSDKTYESYPEKIAPQISPQYAGTINAAFANAVPLTEVSDRWGFGLKIWRLGRNKQ